MIMLSACALSVHAIPILNMFSQHSAQNADTDTRRKLFDNSQLSEPFFDGFTTLKKDVDHDAGAGTQIAFSGDVRGAKVDMSLGVISGPQDLYMGSFEDEYTYYGKTKFQQAQKCVPNVFDYDSDAPIVARKSDGTLLTPLEHRQWCEQVPGVDDNCDANYTNTLACKTACEEAVDGEGTRNICKWGGCERLDQAVAGIFANVAEDELSNETHVTLRHPVLDRDSLQPITFKCEDYERSVSIESSDCEMWGGFEGQRSYVKPEDYCDLVKLDDVVNCFLSDCHDTALKNDEHTYRFGDGLTKRKPTYNWAAMASFTESNPALEPQQGYNKIDFQIEDYDILDQQCYTTLGDLEDEFDDVACKESNHRKYDTTQETNNYKHSHFSAISQKLGGKRQTHHHESRYPDQEFCIDEAQKTLLVELFGCSSEQRIPCKNSAGNRVREPANESLPCTNCDCAGYIDWDQLHEHSDNEMTVRDIFKQHENYGYGTNSKDDDYLCTEAERNVADVLSDYLDKADLDITRACANAKERYHAASKAYLDFVNPNLLAKSDKDVDSEGDAIDNKKEENVWLEDGNLYTVLRQFWRLAEYTIRSSKMQEQILDRFLKFRSWTVYRFDKAGLTPSHPSRKAVEQRMGSLIDNYHGIASEERGKIMEEISTLKSAVDEAKDFAAELAATQAAEAVAVVTVKVHAKKKMMLWQQLETMLETNFEKALKDLKMDENGKNREHTYNNYGETTVHKPKQFETHLQEVGGKDHTIGDDTAIADSVADREVLNKEELERQRTGYRTRSDDDDGVNFKSGYDDGVDDDRVVEYTMTNGVIEIDLHQKGCSPETCDNVYSIVAHIPEDSRSATCVNDKCVVTPGSLQNADENIKHKITITGTGGTETYSSEESSELIDGEIEVTDDLGTRHDGLTPTEHAHQDFQNSGTPECDATHVYVKSITEDSITLHNIRAFDAIDTTGVTEETQTLAGGPIPGAGVSGETLESLRKIKGVAQAGGVRDGEHPIVVVIDACTDAEDANCRLYDTFKSLEDIERMVRITGRECNVAATFESAFKTRANTTFDNLKINSGLSQGSVQANFDNALRSEDVVAKAFEDTIVNCEVSNIRYRVSVDADANPAPDTLKFVEIDNFGQTFDAFPELLGLEGSRSRSVTQDSGAVETYTVTYTARNPSFDSTGTKYSVAAVNVFGSSGLRVHDVLVTNSVGDGIAVFDGSSRLQNVRVTGTANGYSSVTTNGGHSGIFNRLQIVSSNAVGSLIRTGPNEARNGGNTVTIFRDVVINDDQAEQIQISGFQDPRDATKFKPFDFGPNSLVSLNGITYKHTSVSSIQATECTLANTDILYSSGGLRLLELVHVLSDRHIKNTKTIDVSSNKLAYSGSKGYIYVEFPSRVIQTYTFEIVGQDESKSVILDNTEILTYRDGRTEIRDHNGHVVAHTSENIGDDNNGGVNTVLDNSDDRKNIETSTNVITVDHINKFDGTIQRLDQNDQPTNQDDIGSENMDGTIVNTEGEGYQLFSRSPIRCGYNLTGIDSNNQFTYVVADTIGKYVLGMENRNNIVCATMQCTDADQVRGCKVRQTCADHNQARSEPLKGYTPINGASYCTGTAANPEECDTSVGGADRERCYRANQKCEGMINPNTDKYIERTPQIPTNLALTTDVLTDAAITGHVQDKIIDLNGTSATVSSLFRVKIVNSGNKAAVLTVDGNIPADVGHPHPSTDNSVENVVVDNAHLKVTSGSVENVLILANDNHDDPNAPIEYGSSDDTYTGNSGNTYTGLLLEVTSGKSAVDVHFQLGSNPIDQEDQIMPHNYIKSNGEVNGESLGTAASNKLPSTLKRCNALTCVGDDTAETNDVDTCFVTKELCFNFISNNAQWENWRNTDFPESETDFAGTLSCHKDDVPNKESFYCAKEFCDADDFYIESKGGHRGTCCVGGNPQTCEHHKDELKGESEEGDPANSCRANGKGDFANGGESKYLEEQDGPKPANCTGPGVQSCYENCCIQAELVDVYLLAHPEYLRADGEVICDWESCAPKGRDNASFVEREIATDNTGTMPARYFINLLESDETTRCKGVSSTTPGVATGACEFGTANGEEGYVFDASARDVALIAPFVTCKDVFSSQVNEALHAYVVQVGDVSFYNNGQSFASALSAIDAKITYEDQITEEECFTKTLKTTCESQTPSDNNTHYYVPTGLQFYEDTEGYDNDQDGNIDAGITLTSDNGCFTIHEREQRLESDYDLNTDKQDPKSTQYRLAGPRGNHRCQLKECDVGELLADKLTCQRYFKDHEDEKDADKYYPPVSDYDEKYCITSEGDTCELTECYGTPIALAECPEKPADWDTASGSFVDSIQNVRVAYELESDKLKHVEKDGEDKRYCKYQQSEGQSQECRVDECWVQSDCEGRDIVSLNATQRAASAATTDRCGVCDTLSNNDGKTCDAVGHWEKDGGCTADNLNSYTWRPLRGKTLSGVGYDEATNWNKVNRGSKPEETCRDCSITYGDWEDAYDKSCDAGSCDILLRGQWERTINVIHEAGNGNPYNSVNDDDFGKERCDLYYDDDTDIIVNSLPENNGVVQRKAGKPLDCVPYTEAENSARPESEWSYCYEGLNDLTPQKQRSNIKLPAINGLNCSQDLLQFKECTADDIVFDEAPTISVTYQEMDGEEFKEYSVTPRSTVPDPNRNKLYGNLTIPFEAIEFILQEANNKGWPTLGQPNGPTLSVGFWDYTADPVNGHHYVAEFDGSVFLTTTTVTLDENTEWRRELIDENYHPILDENGNPTYQMKPDDLQVPEQLSIMINWRGDARSAAGTITDADGSDINFENRGEPKPYLAIFYHYEQDNDYSSMPFTDVTGVLGVTLSEGVEPEYHDDVTPATTYTLRVGGRVKFTINPAELTWRVGSEPKRTATVEMLLNGEVPFASLELTTDASDESVSHDCGLTRECEMEVVGPTTLDGMTNYTKLGDRLQVQLAFRPEIKNEYLPFSPDPIVATSEGIVMCNNKDQCGLCRNSQREWSCECPAGKKLTGEFNQNEIDDGSHSHCSDCTGDNIHAETTYNDNQCDACSSLYSDTRNVYANDEKTECGIKDVDNEYISADIDTWESAVDKCGRKLVYFGSKTVTADFKSAVFISEDERHYKVSVDGASAQNDPDIELCAGDTLDITRSIDPRTGEPNLSGHTLQISSELFEGTTGSVTFNSSGNYTYVCTSHSSMTGNIIVRDCSNYELPCACDAGEKFTLQRYLGDDGVVATTGGCGDCNQGSEYQDLSNHHETECKICSGTGDEDGNTYILVVDPNRDACNLADCRNQTRAIEVAGGDQFRFNQCDECDSNGDAAGGNLPSGGASQCAEFQVNDIDENLDNDLSQYCTIAKAEETCHDPSNTYTQDSANKDASCPTAEAHALCDCSSLTGHYFTGVYSADTDSRCSKCSETSIIKQDNGTVTIGETQCVACSAEKPDANDDRTVCGVRDDAGDWYADSTALNALTIVDRNGDRCAEVGACGVCDRSQDDSNCGCATHSTTSEPIAQINSDEICVACTGLCGYCDDADIIRSDAEILADGSSTCDTTTGGVTGYATTLGDNCLSESNVAGEMKTIANGCEADPTLAQTTSETSFFKVTSGSLIGGQTVTLSLHGDSHDANVDGVDEDIHNENGYFEVTKDGVPIFTASDTTKTNGVYDAAYADIEVVLPCAAESYQIKVTYHYTNIVNNARTDDSVESTYTITRDPTKILASNGECVSCGSAIPIDGTTCGTACSENQLLMGDGTCVTPALIPVINEGGNLLNVNLAELSGTIQLLTSSSPNVERVFREDGRLTNVKLTDSVIYYPAAVDIRLVQTLPSGVTRTSIVPSGTVDLNEVTCSLVSFCGQ